jgi:hypothetical protein
MRRSVLAVSCLVALLAAGGTAFAQRTTGTIVGTVTDDTGAVLPGVNVSLKGEAVMGTQTATTNDQGFYRFPALPPGTYTLSFAMTGFGTQNRQVKVAVGATIEDNVSLKVSQIAEDITVTAEAAVVDTQTNQISTNYDKEWVRNAPLRRFTFFDLINAAPGVSQVTSTSSRSTSLGSATTDNSYQLDGTDFTAPFTGAAWPWPNTDAIEEIEVLSLGAPAEYGNLQGAVFNVVTRQGGNAFHGDANFYLQHQDLTSRNTTDEQDDSLPYHRDRFNDATFQLSGPVIKDRFWFFGSYQYQRDYESQAGTPPEFPARSDADRIFFKLNYQFNPQHKLMLAYHDDYYRIPGRATALTAPSTITVENGHNPSPNLTYTAVLSSNTYVEARYSGFYGKDHGDPLEEGEPRVKPRYSNLDTGEITGGIYSWYDGDSWKTGFTGKVSHFADEFLGGSHDFKLGVQYNSGGSNYITGPNDYIYHYGNINEPAYGYTQLPWHEGGTMKALGVFADDAFRIGTRATINVGLRYDWSRASIDSFPVLDKLGKETGESSPTIDDVFSWNSVSPRVGVNLKLTGDGKTVLKAHYGRYYRGIVTGEFDNIAPSVTPRYLFSGLYDGRGEPLGLELVSDNSNLTVDPGFKNPYTDQFVVGFERAVLKNLGLQVNYVHKRSRDYGGWRDIGGQYTPITYVDNAGVEATGQSITVFKLVNSPEDRLFQLTNPGEMYTRFNGVTIQLSKPMADRWQMVSSLVLAKSEGLLGSNLGSPTAAQTGTPGSSSGSGLVFGQTPNDYVNTDGLLIGDRPVIFKTQLVWQAPAGFLLGANYTHQSGRPWGRQVRLARGLVGLTTTIAAEKIEGDRRVANWNVLDLRIQKDFRLGGQATLSAFADVLNAFNDDAYESVLSRRADQPDSFGKPTRYLLPRRVMVGAKFRF